MEQNVTTKKPRVVAKPLTAEQKAARLAKANATKAANAYAFSTLAVQFIIDRIAAGSGFYARALSYHRKQGTTFPRARNAQEIARLSGLKEVDARKELAEVKRQHDASILAPGNKTGQAVFDLFMAASKTVT